MSGEAGIRAGETGFDSLLAFNIPDRHARGRVVRLGPVLNTILSSHQYPTAVRDLLAEALVLTTLVGGLIKHDDAQLTVQMQAADSIVDLLVCDYRNGELRGYARHDPIRLTALGTFPSFGNLVGAGVLAITFDLSTSGRRHQGIVPLEAESLTKAFQGYFAQSEQVPTLIRTGVRWDGRSCIAGGILVQHLAEGEAGRTRLHARTDHPEWEHVAAIAGTTRQDELVDASVSLEAMVWRLFHAEREVRIEVLADIAQGCRCSAAYYASVLTRFSEEDRISMRDDDGFVSVDCAFCSRVFKIEA